MKYNPLVSLTLNKTEIKHPGFKTYQSSLNVVSTCYVSTLCRYRSEQDNQAAALMMLSRMEDIH